MSLVGSPKRPPTDHRPGSRQGHVKRGGSWISWEWLQRSVLIMVRLMVVKFFSDVRTKVGCLIHFPFVWVGIAMSKYWNTTKHLSSDQYGINGCHGCKSLSWTTAMNVQVFDMPLPNSCVFEGIWPNPADCLDEFWYYNSLIVGYHGDRTTRFLKA